MSNSKYRRGIVNHQAAGPQTPTAPQPVGRQHDTRIGHQPAPAYEPGVILNSNGVQPGEPRRGIVAPNGQPARSRGLAKATMDARVTQQQIEAGQTEVCNRCGKDRLKSSMITLVQGHHEPEAGGHSGNSVRVCTPCKRQTYRNPQEGTQEEWSPQKQAVRFDQRTGRAYDGSQLGLGELMNGDTYHQGDLNGQTEPDAGPRFDNGRVGKVRG